MNEFKQLSDRINTIEFIEWYVFLFQINENAVFRV